MKRFLILFAILLFVSGAGIAAWYIVKLHRPRVKNASVVTASGKEAEALKAKTNKRGIEAERYASAHHFNTHYCFLVDMSIESGKQRFFVYDMERDAIMNAGLVTHGRCNEQWLVGRRYGNAPGCGCTSLGHYKVGNPYSGRFGLAYKLFGLEGSNSNAYARFVVLHSMGCVPETEVDPMPICQSDGCPTVSKGFLQQLSVMINKSREPVLLWIYE